MATKDPGMNLGGLAAGAVGSSYVSTRLGGPEGKTLFGIVPLEMAIAAACYVAVRSEQLEEYEDILTSVGVGALAAGGWRVVRNGFGDAPAVGAEPRAYYQAELPAAAMALPPGPSQPWLWDQASQLVGGAPYESYDDFIEIHGETGADDELAEAEQALDALAQTRG